MEIYSNTKKMDLNKKCYISKRAETVSDWEDFLNKYLGVCNQNEYHEKSNPNGYINLGTAVNNMSLDIILPRLTSKEVWHCHPTLLQYMEGYGIDSLRKAMANLMTKFLHPHNQVNPENLICSVGVTSSIDMLVHCIADPGDVILAPTPIYPRIYTDFKQRSLVDLWPIPIITEESSGQDQILTLDKIKKAYRSAVEKNQTVKGVFLINPNNPLGDIYDPELLMDILLFCKEHELHAIIDEVYALSVFPDGPQFHSILEFPTVPDIQRTHVLYGLSKDFGISGLRIGAIHTENKTLQRCLKQLAFFQNIPYPMMGIAGKFIEDLDWCSKYISINKQRLGAKYQYCAKRFKEMGLLVRNSVAGFFVWVSFRKVCDLQSFKQERDFFLYLIEKVHLYIVPGEELFCTQPGWFRVTFSGKPEHVQEGLNRIEEAINAYNNPTS